MIPQNFVKYLYTYRIVAYKRLKSSPDSWQSFWYQLFLICEVDKYTCN